MASNSTKRYHHYCIDHDKINTSKQKSDNKIKKYKSMDTFAPNALLPSFNNLYFMPPDRTSDYVVEREPSHRKKKFVKRQLINERDENL